MNPIFQALNSGYPPEKILEYVSKAIPKLGSTIYQAKSAGYTVKQILGFLAKTSSEADTKGMSDPEIRSRNKRVQADMVKNGLTFSAGALGTAALGRSALRAASQLPVGLSTRGTPNAPGTSHMPQTQTPKEALASPKISQSQPLPGNVVSSSPSQPPINNQSPNIITETIKNINPKEILDSSKSTQQVDALLKSGNDSQQVGGYFRKFHDSIVKQVEKEAGKPFEEVVEQYSKEIPKENTPELDKPISSQEDPNNLKELGNVGKNDLKDIEQETESIFSTPSGMGKIKEISGDNVLIEENGKLKQHKLDTLIESPLPEKDIADLYEDLINGIEKSTGKPVSRNVESAGYDPKNNELIYKPHGSDKFYVYDDISPDDVSLLTSFLTQRKSTGRNFIGAWNAGTESPIGAAMYQLIKKLQSERGGKGNEYKNKFETIYDALEPAKEALKKRYAESKKKAKKPRIS